MENQLVVEMAANRVVEHITYEGVAKDAISAACVIIRERIPTYSVGNVVVQVKDRTQNALATCTKLSKMLRAETISESDLTGSISELAYNVFVGHAQDVACEIRQNGGKA